VGQLEESFPLGLKPSLIFATLLEVRAEALTYQSCPFKAALNSETTGIRNRG
jgi:hypothetical protein